VKRWIADAISFSRIALLVPWICLETSASVWALPVMAAIIASDLLDGPIARRLSTASVKGALVDAICDVFVLVVAAIVLGLKDARYLGLAGLMASAFTSWGIRSLIAGRFAYSRMGRYDGALCYALIAAASARPWLAALGIRAPAFGEWAAICLVAVCLAVSAAENIVRILRASADARVGTVGSNCNRQPPKHLRVPPVRVREHVRREYEKSEQDLVQNIEGKRIPAPCGEERHVFFPIRRSADGIRNRSAPR
jgi:phosphatidylglycerophosphate synthase